MQLEALVAIAVHFSNPDKRAALFLDIVNHHLPEVDADDDDAAWTLSRPTYERMIDSLFRPLMKAITGPENRAAFAKCFGAGTLAAVTDIMRSWA